MTDSPHSPPESEDSAPTLHDADERWTIPWAVVSEDDRPIAADATLRWHGLSDTVEFGTHEITRPMIYTSAGRTADAETSCIDTTLPVGDVDFDGAPALAHWTSYAGLTPSQRANYLAWLASGRKGALNDMNYAFLFFYGLERYALVDKGDPEDVLRVLMRLLNTYKTSPSFFSGASRLAAFLFATKGIEKLKPAWFDRLFMQGNVPLHSDSLAVAATWLYEREKPLPPELALEIVRQDIRCGHAGEATMDEERAQRFKEAYSACYGEGMPLAASEKPQTWKYRPVNPSLQSWEHFASLWSVTSADVMGAYQQFDGLVALWRACCEDVENKSPWRTLIDDHVSPQGRVLVPVAKVAKLVGVAVKKGKDFTLAESLAIRMAAQEGGYELLPEPALLLRPYKAKERVVITRSAPGVTDSDGYYRAGALLLALGTAMAVADGEVDHVEVLHVSEIVNSLYHFNDHDKKRLGILRRRLIKFPPKLTSLTRRLRAILTEAEREEAGRFLVGVAGANFTVCEEERKALRRAYRAFGIPVANLDALLARLVAEEDGSTVIDRDELAQHMRDTQAFAARLGVAMQGVVPLEGPAAGKRGIWYGRLGSVAPVDTIVEERVADPYCDALYALVQRGDWTEAEFVALGEKHGVYAPGLTAAMEDWEGEVMDEEAGRAVRYAFSSEAMEEEEGEG